MTELFKNIEMWFARNTYYDRVGPKPTVFIAGSARSGTTWIGDLIESGGSFRTLFEPFHYNRSNHGKVFVPHEYISQKGGTEAQFHALEAVFNGRVQGIWEDQSNRCLFPSARLIKDIHSNLRLKWIKIHFPDVKFLYVIRHPISVALSRIKLGWEGPRILDLLEQKRLIEDFPEIREASKLVGFFPNEPILSHIFLWCVQQKVALTQLDATDVMVIAYENFLADPKSETGEVYRWLGLSKKIPREKTLRKKSWTSGKQNYTDRKSVV